MAGKKNQSGAGIDWNAISAAEKHKIYHSLRQEAIRRAINDEAGRAIYERCLAECKAEIGYPEDSAKPQRGENRFALLKRQLSAAKAE